MPLNTILFAALVTLFAPLAHGAGIEILQVDYSSFEKVCFESGLRVDDVDQFGNFKEREDNMVCNFVTPSGKLNSGEDAQYKMIVNWITPNEEDTWDELALFYNNALLRFGDRGMPDWVWDGFTILKDQKGAFALIAQRGSSAYHAHHFVVYLNQDKSCRLQVPHPDRFMGLSAFKDELKALEQAMKLSSRKNIPCEKNAEYVN